MFKSTLNLHQTKLLHLERVPGLSWPQQCHQIRPFELQVSGLGVRANNEHFEVRMASGRIATDESMYGFLCFPLQFGKFLIGFPFQIPVDSFWGDIEYVLP